MMLPADCNPVKAKQKFAAALLRHPHEHFKAAMLTFPRNSGAALWIMQEWVSDEYVLEYQKQLLEEFGPQYFLPTKEELSHEVHATAVQARDPDAKIKAYKLFAEIQGYINKPASVAVQVNNIKQKVLVIREYSDAQIEEGQARLLREMAQDAE